MSRRILTVLIAAASVASTMLATMPRAEASAPQSPITFGSYRIVL